MERGGEEEKKGEEESVKSEDGEENIDDIDNLLGDGGSKQYVITKPSSEVSLMQRWLLDNESTVKIQEPKELYTDYLSNSSLKIHNKI